MLGCYLKCGQEIDNFQPFDGLFRKEKVQLKLHLKILSLKHILKSQVCRQEVFHLLHNGMHHIIKKGI